MTELLAALVDAEEGVRSRLAAELHDTVAQSLMLARGLLADLGSAPDHLAEVRRLVETAEEQVRALLARTRPSALCDGDLAAAVADLRLDLLARYGLAVRVRWPDETATLSPAGAATVYRFFQEALLNVAKHARVDTALLELTVSATCVVATVADGGSGFAPDDVRAAGGRRVGLALLRERVRLSGGSLQVRSAPGAGTTLVLELPRTGQAARPRLPALVV